MKKLLLALAIVCLSGVSAAQPGTAFPNLLTGQTPFNHTVPNGWTIVASEDFENGSCINAWCGGNFNSIKFHNDGNAAHTHSLGCTYNDQLQVQDATHAGACGGFNWNKFLPTGTGEVYVSFYTYLTPSFRMNDEMFLLRFHWDTGNGQPAFRENVVDYFQNSTGQYNSTDATLLNNIQGQPYYQNKLPGNTPGDTTNFTPITGTFANQIEYYAKYSTVTPAKVLSSGVVTLNAAAHTYTRTTGSWISDGVLVGSSPHFVGFSSSPNNNDGSAGGGGYSLFVTSVTDTVMTVGASPYITNDTATNPTMQLDNGDGAFAMYVNGVLQGHQENMVFPGKYDFSTSNTTLSLMESYSKLIWRAPVGGNCETNSAPPPAYTGTCAAGIGGNYSPGGCGFERMDFGWNASGFTRLSGGSTPYTVPIDCAPSPMPNPPVFDRFLDDVIVLTRPRTAPPTTVSAASLTAGVDGCSNPTQTVSFPAYGKFTLNAGTVSNCGAGGNTDSGFPSQGITSYFDLKNDPTGLYNFGAADTGMFEHQWGIKNQDGTTRYNEVKEGPMAITVAESNNVRVKLTQSGAVRSVGNLSNTADCCMTMTKSYVFYRHGGTSTGSGATKVYTKTTINYDNGDSQAPLTTAGTSTGINYYNKIGWWKVSGEANKQTNPCPSPGSLGTFTLSPWNIIYPGTQGTNASKNYILYAPVNANDTNSTEFLPANPCTSPAATNPGPENTTSGQPQPGTVMLCNGATNTACVSQSAAPVTVKANFLQIENEQQCSFMSIGTQNYFLGGLRTYCALGSQTFPANTPRSWTSVGFIGDNGITSDGAASSFVTEYKTPPTLTFVTGSGGTFDPVEGYWTLAAVTNGASFSANGVLHSPAFLVSNYTAAAPTTMVVGGVTKTLNTDFVAAKTDSTHLLLQVLSDIASGTNIQLVSTGSAFTISPTTANVVINGTQQMTASGPAYWFANAGTIDTTGLYTAPGTPTVATVTGAEQTILANDLNTQSNWQTCGNCGDSGGPNGQPNGTFTLTAGNPATFSAAGNYPFNNGFWYYVMLPAGGYNSTVDFQLSFKMRFKTQADKNASQAVEFELQKNVLDQQYSMAWQICFACGNKLRVFNKTAHAWEDTGLTFDPTIFAGGKWVSIQTVYHLTTGTPGVTRHVSISLNGVNHVVNIDHATTPAVESDYLHPAFQLDSNGQSPPTPYSVEVSDFDVGTPTGRTATATITSLSNPLTLAPTTWPFSQVNTNQIVTQQYTVSNTGSVTTGISGITKTGSANYVMTQNSCGTSLAAGSTCNFTVQFSSAVTGTFTGSVNVSDISGGSNTVNFSTTVVTPAVQPTISPTSVTLGIGTQQQFTTNFTTGQTWSATAGTVSPSGLYTAPSSAGPASVTIKNSIGQSATAAVTVTSSVTASPTSVNFGSILAGQAVTNQTVITNNNTIAVTLTGISVTGTAFSYNAALSTCKVGTAIPAQGSCFLTLGFLPPSSGSFTGTATVSDSAKGSLTIPLAGSAQVPSPVSVSPTSFSWGNVKTGTTSNTTFTVSNFGPVNVTVSSLAITGTGFSFGSGTCFNGIILNPQATCTAIVTFAPVSAISYTGNLAIVDNSPHTTNAALSGVGTTPPSVVTRTFRNLTIKGPITIN